MAEHSGAGYWWRVRSVDPDGRLGPFSVPRYVSRRAPSPDPVRPPGGATIGIGASPPSVTLEWRGSPMLTKYVVEVARDGRLGGVDFVIAEQVDQLGLGRDRGLAQEADDQVLTRRLAHVSPSAKAR